MCLVGHNTLQRTAQARAERIVVLSMMAHVQKGKTMRARLGGNECTDLSPY